MLTAILERDVPLLSQSVADVPPALERVVEKALRKNRDERYQSVRDLQQELRVIRSELDTAERVASGWRPGTQHAAASPPISVPPPALAGARTHTLWLLTAALVIVALAAGTYLTILRPGTLPPRENPQPIATPLTAYPGAENKPSLSPDGSQVAFTWDGPRQDNFDIYVKLVGPGEPMRLTTAPDSRRQPRLVARRPPHCVPADCSEARGRRNVLHPGGSVRDACARRCGTPRGSGHRQRLPRISRPRMDA